MNQKLAIILILIAGGMGIAYSTSGQIQIGPTNCIGIACDSNTFTTYTPIVNETISGSGSSQSRNFNIDTNGTVSMQSQGSGELYIIYKTGTIIDLLTSSHTSHFVPWVSTTGKYKVDIDFNTQNIKVLSGTSIVSTIGLDVTNWSGQLYDSAISPDGKFIVVEGKDTSGTKQRVVILEGS